MIVLQAFQKVFFNSFISVKVTLLLEKKIFKQSQAKQIEFKAIFYTFNEAIQKGTAKSSEFVRGRQHCS